MITRERVNVRRLLSFFFNKARDKDETFVRFEFIFGSCLAQYRGRRFSIHFHDDFMLEPRQRYDRGV